VQQARQQVEQAQWETRQAELARNNPGAIPPVILAAGTVVTVGGLAMSSLANRSVNSTAMVSKSASDNAVPSSVNANGATTAAMAGLPSRLQTVSPLSAMPPRAISNGNSIANDSSQQPPADKVAWADQKMQDYLNQDYGEDAWLMSIQQILTTNEDIAGEDEEEEVYVNVKTTGTNGLPVNATMEGKTSTDIDTEWM
jgi:hypothetical protein